MQGQVVIEESKCPQCGCNAIRFIDGHPICISCGLVIDQANQIGYKSLGEKRSKKKSKLLRELLASREQHGIPRCIDVKTLMDSLGISDSVEEKIAHTIASIIDLAGKLGLSDDVNEIALNIYEGIAKKSTFKGKGTRALSAAIVYAASKKAGKVCGLHEISRAAGIRTNKVFKCYRFVLENLDYHMHYPSIEEYIERICGKLALSKNTANIAKKIAVTARNYTQTKGTHSSLTAASIYISSIINDERRTQREIADAIGITEATIRSKYKEIAREFQIILTI